MGHSSTRGRTSQISLPLRRRLPNGVRVWLGVDAKSRVVQFVRRPSGDPEEQRDIVRIVVCDHEVGQTVPVEIRDG